MYGKEKAEREVNNIFKLVDTDQSGKIDYSEWIVATIDKTKLITDEKMETAYDLFDKNDKGNIRTSDVKDLVC